MAANKLLVPILLLSYFLGWILALAGIAAVQDQSFSYSLSLEWFILFLQLLVIIAIPALSLMGKIQQVKLFMIHMLAILSTLWLTFANRGYVQMRSGNSGVSSSRLNTAIAGACVLFVTNLLAALIIELDSAAGSDEITVAAPSAKGVPTPTPAPAAAV